MHLGSVKKWLQPREGAAWETGQGTPPDSPKGSLRDVSGLTPLSFQAGNPLDTFFLPLLD